MSEGVRGRVVAPNLAGVDVGREGTIVAAPDRLDTEHFWTEFGEQWVDFSDGERQRQLRRVLFVVVDEPTSSR